MWTIENQFKIQAGTSHAQLHLGSCGGHSSVVGVILRGIFLGGQISLASAPSQIHPSVHSIIYSTSSLTLLCSGTPWPRPERNQKMLQLPEMRECERGKRQASAQFSLQLVSLQVWRQSRLGQGGEIWTPCRCFMKPTREASCPKSRNPSKKTATLLL